MADKEQLFVYEDDYTGKKYLFDGTKLVELPDNAYDNDDKPPYHIETEDDESKVDGDPGDTDKNTDPEENKENKKPEEPGDYPEEPGDYPEEPGDYPEEPQKNNKEEIDKPDSYPEKEDKDKSDSKQDEPGINPGNLNPKGKDSTNPEEIDEPGYPDESQKGYEEDDDNINEPGEFNPDNNKKNQSSNSKNDTNDNINDKSEEGDLNSPLDMDDIDWDNIDWDELKEVVDEILDQIDNLSEEQRQKFLNELKKHLDEVDEDVLEKEEEERQKQIEQEIGEYNPEDDDSDARIKEIANDLQNDAVYKDLMDETDRHVYQDRAKRNKAKKKAEQEANKYNASKGVQDFVLDLNRLIKREVKKLNSTSWGKINKKTEGTGILKPGKTKKKNPDIPRLFVYFDQSGSWGAKDIEVGIKAIETLNTYVKKNQLIIELYYFANDIHDNAAAARNEGQTRAGRRLIEHIKANKPDNVCVMTDDDFDGYIGYNDWKDISTASTVVVPGGVFLMFRNGEVSKGLVDKLRGKKLTKIYAF